MSINYCKKCFETSLRPGMKFVRGICLPCTYFKKFNKPSLIELKSITSKFKNKNNLYDCIIGVSGGKDSLKQANFVKNKLKLRPLLVCLSYPPETVTETGILNLNNLIEQGFDLIISAPNPKIWKILVKESFFKFGNFRVPSELALFSSVPQMAIKHNISLIFWGENPGSHLGESEVLKKNGWDGNFLRKLNTLKGTNINWMLKKVSKKELILPYFYPSKKEFVKNKIQIVFLGYFFRNWSIVNNAKYAIANGLTIRKEDPLKTGDLFGYQSLDEDFVHVNQMIKYFKYGYGRATEYINEMIRLKKIDRKQGGILIKKFDGKCSRNHIKKFCSYIDISERQFWKKIHSLLNKKLFKVEKGKIKSLFNVK